MAERDLRTPFTETSFCVPDDEQSFLLVQSAPIADPFKSALNDGQKSSSAISRFVKSAFDGAVNLGKTIAQVGTQSGECYTFLIEQGSFIKLHASVATLTIKLCITVAICSSYSVRA